MKLRFYISLLKYVEFRLFLVRNNDFISSIKVSILLTYLRHTEKIMWPYSWIWKSTGRPPKCYDINLLDLHFYYEPERLHVQRPEGVLSFPWGTATNNWKCVISEPRPERTLSAPRVTQTENWKYVVSVQKP